MPALCYSTGIRLFQMHKHSHHHHHHGHSHHHHHHDSEGGLKVAFFINLLFTLIELAGGIYTNSIAIISDAIHDFGDSFSLGLSWYFEKISKKKRTPSFSFGYKRFSLLAALINATILMVSSVFIIYKASERIVHPEEVNANGMLILAILGVLFNGFAFLKLSNGTSMNERVIRLHIIEDILGWIAVLIGSILLQFWNIPILDPLLSIGISGFIAFNAFKNLKGTLRILLQAVPDDKKMDEIHAILLSFQDIKGVHDLHVWGLNETYVILTVHLIVAPEKTINDLSHLKEAIKLRLSNYGIEHTTIEFESADEKCNLENC
jgi:cobalt-zinc-cadmium efflux system protein